MQLSPRASRCPYPPEPCANVPASGRMLRPSCPLAVTVASLTGSARPRGLAPGRQRGNHSTARAALSASLARLGFPEPEAPRPSSTSLTSAPEPSPVRVRLGSRATRKPPLGSRCAPRWPSSPRSAWRRLPCRARRPSGPRAFAFGQGFPLAASACAALPCRRCRRLLPRTRGGS